MTISTHVLDATRGKPAVGLALTLERLEGDRWVVLGGGVTDADGRCPGLTADLEPVTGTHRIRFETGTYFAARDVATFYPVVELTFALADAGSHYHVPLLLSPFAFSTYRGS